MKSLHEAGAEIIYHCFYYEGHNPPTDELEKYCSKLYYYERKKKLSKLFFSRLPYVVTSRNNPELLVNLLADPAPVLMDGIQCTYWILHKDVQDQKILYRANNIEHEYYEGLAKAEKRWLKKIYLLREAKKLARYEWQIKHADVILSVAKQDIPHFERYGEVVHLPPFYDDTHTIDLSQPAPIQKYVLFQGNLSVTENQNASEYIIKNIAPLVDHQIIIAGKEPSDSLKHLASTQKNVQLIDTPSQGEMTKLIQDAQIHLLLTFQQTGIKLKLLHALQSGRHILINSMMDDDGIFSDMCEVAELPKEFAVKIDQLMDLPFTSQMKADRDAKFNAIYSNKKKAEDILRLI
ncbi:MAG: hypothetical protein H6582_13895 [Crocinitomicaceae bacterium]|nr:hypothetical protein [Crocinitomicaceae bacterium]